MLVLLGPRYSSTNEELTLLTAETGLSSYDLRMRLRPGAWSVVRAVAEQQQAEVMSQRLARAGFQSCALNSTVGMDPSRPIVYLREIDGTQTHIYMRIAEREMTVPVGAALTIVRGDVHLGRLVHVAAATTSSSAMRAAAPISLQPSLASPAESARDQRGGIDQDVFVAADLHFVTVPWVARIDPRDCALSGAMSGSVNHAERLDEFIDALARTAGIRVDRDIKVSNLVSHLTAPQRQPTPASGPISTRRGHVSNDEHFDAYSRLIGEAERRTWIGS